MKSIFGPVNSRRLGISLGIDLLPPKICNFNCIYCEIGPITRFTCERAEYTPTAGIIAEIDAFFADQEAVARLDVLTVTASGEPTLHSGLGEIIRHLKAISDKPVAVLTNGSLLHQAEVRAELAPADIVIPSLDAAREESYRRINRPAACASLALVLEGLIAFGREFKGRCWLEILLAKGINDQPEDLAALQAAVAQIRPERIQLNTVARPPLEAFALPLDLAGMRAAAACFPELPVDILTDPASRDHREKFRRVSEEEVLNLLRRRPCTREDVAAALGLEPAAAAALLQGLRDRGLVHLAPHRNQDYFQPTPATSTEPL